jgi:hypothetical protein
VVGEDDCGRSSLFIAQAQCLREFVSSVHFSLNTFLKHFRYFVELKSDTLNARSTMGQEQPKRL